jgi:hypothetical protein
MLKRMFPSLAELEASKLMVAPFAFVAVCVVFATPIRLIVWGFP